MRAPLCPSGDVRMPGRGPPVARDIICATLVAMRDTALSVDIDTITRPGPTVNCPLPGSTEAGAGMMSRHVGGAAVAAGAFARGARAHAADIANPTHTLQTRARWIICLCPFVDTGMLHSPG